MNEIEQLKILMADADFWQRQDVQSSCVGSGISIAVTSCSGKFGWKIKWSDHSELLSNRAFTSWQEAKLHLREFLREKLAEFVGLEYAASSPAGVEMHPR